MHQQYRVCEESDKVGGRVRREDGSRGYKLIEKAVAKLITQSSLSICLCPRMFVGVGMKHPTERERERERERESVYSTDLRSLLVFGLAL